MVHQEGKQPIVCRSSRTNYGKGEAHKESRAFPLEFSLEHSY